MIVIIDDEVYFAEKLKKELEKYYTDEEIVILDNFDFNFLNSYAIDFLFLDIELKGENGIERAKEYRDLGHDNLNIIFVTFHDEAVYGVFEANPLSFVRKNKLKVDLEKTVKIIELKKKKEQMQTIIDGHKINLVDVLYIESQGNKLYYRGANNEEILERREKMSTVEKELEKYHFIRCHKSYIVNAAFITKARTNYAIINNHIKIPVSRSEQKHFMDKYHEYYITKKNI